MERAGREPGGTGRGNPPKDEQAGQTAGKPRGLRGFACGRRYLAKHRSLAAKYLERIAGTTYQSKVAAGYQRRLAKSGTKLFTFLSHDGVSWNNNVAENAIKLFASRRRVMGSTFTEKGIGDYLLFLSIYATLRRKGLSFLKFLRSTEGIVDSFPGI
jgi:hypothetical protein